MVEGWPGLRGTRWLRGSRELHVSRVHTPLRCISGHVGKALATDLVPQRLRASGVGLYASTVGLSGLIASVVGGQLWVQIGPAATFLYGAVFAVLGAVLLGVLVPGDNASANDAEIGRT